jgi:hypothetical protein
MDMGVKMTESNEIKEIEKEVHGIVKIGVEEPKKVKKKHLFIENDIIAEKSIKGDFDEKTPIQNIKPIKKIHYKPFVSEIQEEKVIENTEIDNLDNLKKEIKAKENLLNLMKKEKEISEKIQKKELKIKLKAEKKELKLKKKAEKREKRRKHWYFRIFMKKEKKPIEIGTKEKVEDLIPKEIYSNPNEFKLIEANDTIFKICPICNSKIKKQKVIQEYGTFRQIFKCKKCPFSKEVVIKL